MLEKIGTSEIIVNDYTSNFNVKEMIHDHLIPKAFPNIPMNKLNIGFTGIVSEYIGQVIEDAYSTAVLMMNESFITKSILPNSIYSEASTYKLGYSFAVPSRCDFALQLALDDVIKYSEPVANESVRRYVLDKDTRIILGDNFYKLDYDIIIDHIIQDGKRVFKIYYDIKEKNSISDINSAYIKYQVTSINWLVLFLNLKEFDRKVDEISLTDNLITTNSDIEISWTNQIAGLDLVYIDPFGNRIPMSLNIENTNMSIEPFVWYRFKDLNTIVLRFSTTEGYWAPDFNSKIEYTVYTCNGKESNFDIYDNKSGIPVQKNAERFNYNASTRMIALCYGGSVGGLDKGTIEDLRNDIIIKKNTCNSLGTSNDIQMWFDKYANMFGSKSKTFKRRDDPSGQLFAQFISINNNSYIYPTNTLSINVGQEDFDYINENNGNKEFIINAGHLWEYDGDSRNTVKMVKGISSNNVMITDDGVNTIAKDKDFLFVNPYMIKINLNPMISVTYDYLMNHTSWPNDIPINVNSFYQFQLATLNIYRSLSKKNIDAYDIEVICVPSITDDKLKYVEGIGGSFPLVNNKLRLVMILQNSDDGENAYIEMEPTEIREAGSIVFKTKLYVKDNILDNKKIEVDLKKTKNIKPLISSNTSGVFIDINEPRFHFVSMMKNKISLNSGLFNDETFKDYIMTNRFVNDYRGLELYKPLSMMRSLTNITEENGKYKINLSLIPFLKWDIVLDDSKMAYFIQTFKNQYNALKPIISRIEGNAFLDFKLFNTYGRSNNYFIGPQEGSENLRDSKIILDDVYVKIKLRMSVYDRSLYSQTSSEVIKEIISFFNRMNNGETSDVHVSNILREIETKINNVRYIRFLGFNKYDANKQSIFLKYYDETMMNKPQISNYVPEIIRVDASSIEITEEV